MPLRKDRDIGVALNQPLFNPQPFELDGSPSGEDPKYEELAWLGRHGPLVVDREVPQDISFSVEQRHSEITLDPLVFEISIERKFLVDAKRVMAKASANHILTWCSDEVVLDVREDFAIAPVGQGPNSRGDAGEFGDEGMIHADRGCEMSHEGLEKDRARAPPGSLDDRPQRDNLVVNRCRSPRLLVRHSQRTADCLAYARFPVLAIIGACPAQRQDQHVPGAASAHREAASSSAFVSARPTRLGVRPRPATALRIQDSAEDAFLDQRPQQAVGFCPKRGKSREIPVRHDLEGFILAYVDAAGIAGDAKDTPLFQASNGRERGQNQCQFFFSQKRGQNQCQFFFSQKRGQNQCQFFFSQ